MRGNPNEGINQKNQKLAECADKYALDVIKDLYLECNSRLCSKDYFPITNPFCMIVHSFIKSFLFTSAYQIKNGKMSTCHFMIFSCVCMYFYNFIMNCF